MDEYKDENTRLFMKEYLTIIKKGGPKSYESIFFSNISSLEKIKRDCA